MKSSDKLIKDFAQVCGEYGGELHESLGKKECYFGDTKKIDFNMSLSTLSSTVKVSADNSNIEMFDVKEIKKSFPKNITFISKEGNIINARPGIGIATFKGALNGAISTHGEII